MNYLGCWICSSYILQEKLNKILLEPDWPFVSFWNLKPFNFIFSYSFSFVVPTLSLAVTHCHLLSLVVIHCYSLSFVFTRFITRCHSLSRVVIRCTSCCHSLYHSLPFAATCCTTRCYSFSLDVPLVCLFINDHNTVWKKIWQHILMIFFQVFHYSIYLLVGM